jgi:hypothetical protein
MQPTTDPDVAGVMEGPWEYGERLSSVEHDARDAVEDEHIECDSPDSE